MGDARAEDKSKKERSLLVAACVTGGFLLVQMLVGVAIGSLTLLAAAGLMLSNTIALALSWTALRFAGEAATFSPRYRLVRARTLIAYTGGVASFTIGIWIVAEAVDRMGAASPVLAWPMLAVAVLGLVVNGVVFFLLYRGDLENRDPRRVVRHVTGDLFGAAIATVAAVILLLSGWAPIDTLLAVPLAVLILLSASVLVGETGHRLLQDVSVKPDRDIIAHDIKTNVKGVVDVRHLHIWSSDGARTMATLQAFLGDGVDAHAAICDIKLRLAKHHRIEHVTVEPEFGHNLSRPAGTHLH